MASMIFIPENVYKALMCAELPEKVNDAFLNHAERIVEVTAKYALSVTDEDKELLDAAETRIFHILRFCFIVQMIPALDMLDSLLRESEENSALSDMLFYDSTEDFELTANEIVYIAFELMKDVKGAMEIDLD